MKTTLDLPESLLNEVETRARQEGCKLNDAVIELLRRGLSSSSSSPPSRRRTEFKMHPQSGLPFIECRADAAARRMTAQDLLALERETLDREDGERLGLSC